VAVEISWTIHKSFAPHSRQITTPTSHHSDSLQARCSSCHPTNSIKALKERQTQKGGKKAHAVIRPADGVQCQHDTSHSCQSNASCLLDMTLETPAYHCPCQTPPHPDSNTNTHKSHKNKQVTSS